MNKVFLVGRLTKDPELRYTSGDNPTAVVNFNLAVNKRLSKEKRQEMESQNKPTADFPRIIVWGKMAENVANYLSKGSQCAVDGSIETGSYQDKDGKTVYTTEVRADNVEFLTSANQNNGQAPYNTQNQNNNNNQSFNQQNQNNYQQYQQQPANNQQNQQKQQYQPMNDDFFNDDFTEITDDGRIPF